MINKILFIALFSVTTFLNTSQAQVASYSLSEINQFTIDGGSNARSWDANVTTASGTLELTNSSDFTLESLTAEAFQSLTLSIPVSGIESDTRGLTRNLQGYLKGDEHPVITFLLTSIEEIEASGNSALITASSVITAAGVSHDTMVTVEATLNSNGTLSFKGTHPLLMTSFEISPPTAVFGTIRANDEIDILFDVTFSLD